MKRAPPAGGAGLAVEVHVLPALQDLRLALRQPGAHREIGLGQEQRVAVVADGRLVARRIVHRECAGPLLAARKRRARECGQQCVQARF
jgi:hypothetical protein